MRVYIGEIEYRRDDQCELWETFKEVGKLFDKYGLYSFYFSRFRKKMFNNKLYGNLFN